MQFIKTRDVKTPSRGTPESAGLDFYVPTDFEPILLTQGKSVNIPSGIKMILPKGKIGLFLNKSGIGKGGLLVGAQVIDSDYRGEVHLNIHNVGTYCVMIKPGMKLVQMIITNIDLDSPQEVTEEWFEFHSDTIRGEGGFGSTGEF